MVNLSETVRWYGRDEPPIYSRRLSAGPTTVLLEGADLRYMRVGGREILRRLYVAVRDPNWNTLAVDIANMNVDQGVDRFSVSFDVRQAKGDIDFGWRGEIRGASDGTISYTMDGRAHRAFRYNRIGLCVLHPPETSAGQHFTCATPGGQVSGTLPDLIGPQLIKNGQIFALFPAFDRLAIELDGGGTVTFDFEGDLFEMEDQRNWTDASFKTYSTPLALPFPKDAAAGEVLRQRVTIAATGLQVSDAPPSIEEPTVQLNIGNGLGLRVPPLGLGMASHGRSLTASELERLRVLRLTHIRVDLTPSNAEWSAELDRARAVAEILACDLELALFLAGDGQEDLARLATALVGAPIARVLVFHAVTGGRGDNAISIGPMVQAAKIALNSVTGDVLFAGGTNYYFTELNRRRPDPSMMDMIAFSMNPQVHASDERSLTETLTAQGEPVRSARAYFGNCPVAVSPVTLKPRLNPAATQSTDTPPGNTLPDEVDARQMSLYGAVWTAGSLAALARSGVASLTYFETTGWRGVIETEVGSDTPAFPSQPGKVFPLYHVFADVAEWRDGELVDATSSDPLSVTMLAVRNTAGLHLLIGNMTPYDQVVALGGISAETIHQRRLTAANYWEAALDAEHYRAATSSSESRGGGLTWTLAPFELLRLDMPGPGSAP